MYFDENKQEINAPVNMLFVEQRKNVDCSSALQSFEGPFELLHGYIADIRILAKSAINPKHFFLFVDLFTSKIYTYPMKNRSFLCTEIKLLYDEISKKRNMDKEMRIQADREFEQNEIKRINKKVHMFSSKVHGCKILQRNK